MGQLRRRRFLIGAGALAATSLVRAQALGQSRIHRVGFLGISNAAVAAPYLQALMVELNALGYLEGRNLVIEHRFAEGRPDRFLELSAQLVELGVDIIVTNDQGAHAVKRSSTTIPIVMAWSVNPIASGLVASLARPGGNVTGLTVDVGTEMATRRLQIYKEALPNLKRIAAIWESNEPGFASYWPDVNTASKLLGIETYSAELRSTGELGRAFERIRKDRPNALWLWGGAIVRHNLKAIIDFAMAEGIPPIAATTDFVASGCLIAYSTDFLDLYRRAAEYVDKILKGARPGDLPIQLPRRFELAVNLKTAKSLNLTIPQSILLRADRVIE